MKKSISIAVATLLLVCVAFTGLSLAGAVKRTLNDTMVAPSSPTKGFVIVNRPSAKSPIVVILEVQARGLVPGTTYVIGSGGAGEIGRFVADASGKGHFHCNYRTIPSPALDPGKTVKIWDTSTTPFWTMVQESDLI